MLKITQEKHDDVLVAQALIDVARVTRVARRLGVWPDFSVTEAGVWAIERQGPQV